MATPFDSPKWNLAPSPSIRPSALARRVRASALRWQLTRTWSSVTRRCPLLRAPFCPGPKRGRGYTDISETSWEDWPRISSFPSIHPGKNFPRKCRMPCCTGTTSKWSSSGETATAETSNIRPALRASCPIWSASTTRPNPTGRSSATPTTSAKCPVEAVRAQG